MVKILIDLSACEDRTVEIYKLVNNLKTKQEAVKQIIMHFEVEVKPKKIALGEYFK